MESQILSDEIREKLRKPFPDEAISQHPTKTFLSTIKAIYIVERLNDVFGIGGWDMTHRIVDDTPEYVSVCGKITLKEPYNFSTPKQYGGHKKTGKNSEPADGYKSAVTDCQSKCASYLEIGIDVFKGKHTASSRASPEVKDDTPKKDNEISSKQWNFLKSLGENIAMTEKELITLVKWVASENNIEPRSYKIAKLMLPQESFDARLAEFSKANIKEVMDEDIEESF